MVLSRSVCSLVYTHQCYGRIVNMKAQNPAEAGVLSSLFLRLFRLSLEETLEMFDIHILTPWRFMMIPCWVMSRLFHAQ